jgi:hypothetical protein
MFDSAKQIGMAAVLGLAVCAWAGAQVRAQNGPRKTGQAVTMQPSSSLALTAQLQQALLTSTLGLSPYAGFGNFAGLSSAYSAGANPYASLYTNPYSSPGPGAGLYGANSASGQYSSPYSSPYTYEDPNGAYLNGAANVINAQSRFVVSEQLAYQIREQARGERTASRRKVFDQYLYEREKTSTAEQERQKAQLDQVNRSRHNPPLTEIWSGKALNDLLADLRELNPPGDSANGSAPPLPLDEAGLKHINVSKHVGSIALLKNGGQLHWPVALIGPDSEEQRAQLNVGAQAAVRQAEYNGHVDPVMIQRMRSDVDRLHKHLRLNVKNLSPSEYIEAKTFLNHFGEALHALGLSDVGNHFTGEYVLKAGTVPELVKQMVEKGLQFAPALPRDEAAYRALHQALAAYDRAARPEVTER